MRKRCCHMKKLLRGLLQFSLVLGFVFMFSSLTYASPTSDEQAFIDYFDIDESILYEQVENSKETKDEVNDFDFIQFVQGFTKYYAPTFSQDKYLVGEGSAGIEVGILIYSIENEEIQVQGDITIDTLGASGIFNKTITYEVLGENHIIIAVKKEGKTVYKHFVVNRKAKETKEKLELLDINLLKITGTNGQ